MLINDVKQLKPPMLTAILRVHEFLSDDELVTQVHILSKTEGDAASQYTLSVKYKDFRTQRHAPDRIVVTLYKPSYQTAQHEVTFCNTVLRFAQQQQSITDLRIPQCYDAYFDAATDEAHILMEDISTAFREQRDNVPPTKRHREQIIDALASLHGAWWEHGRLPLLRAMPDELQHERELIAAQQGLANVKAHPSSRLSPQQLDILTKITTAYPQGQQARFLAGDGVTVIHGDLHAQRLRYAHQDIRIVGWKAWRVGLGTDDLARIMACYWPEPMHRMEAKPLLQRYHRHLQAMGVQQYTWEQCWYDYRASIANVIREDLRNWSRDKMKSGAWQPTLSALNTFIKVDGLQIYR